MECSAESTVCILIKPDDDKESHQPEKSLIKNGEYTFYLTKHRARLQPIYFGSHSFPYMESKFQSFTGKPASVRWDIGENRKYI